MPKRSKPSAKWTRLALLAYIGELEEKFAALKAAVPTETVTSFASKQAIIDEIYRLYNAPGVPVQKRIELLETIAREQHGMFKEKKGASNAVDDFLTFFRGLTTKELEDQG